MSEVWTMEHGFDDHAIELLEHAASSLRLAAGYLTPLGEHVDLTGWADEIIAWVDGDHDRKTNNE